MTMVETKIYICDKCEKEIKDGDSASSIDFSVGFTEEDGGDSFSVQFFDLCRECSKPLVDLLKTLDDSWKYE